MMRRFSFRHLVSYVCVEDFLLKMDMSKPQQANCLLMIDRSRRDKWTQATVEACYVGIVKAYSTSLDEAIESCRESACRAHTPEAVA